MRSTTKCSNKLVAQKPDPSPTIKVNIKLDIMAYKTHSPPLKIMMTKEFVKKLTMTMTVNPRPSSIFAAPLKLSLLVAARQ
jgi:hypothetical protein